AAESVQRLRNFRQRLSVSQFSEGSSEEISQVAMQTMERMRAALDDDLNTAQAQAAIFDMVRKANAAADAGQLRRADVGTLLAALQEFDGIFAVLEDDDEPKVRRILDWAQSEGKLEQASKEVREAAASDRLSDSEIEGLIGKMDQARRARDFATS